MHLQVHISNTLTSHPLSWHPPPSHFKRITTNFSTTLQGTSSTMMLEKANKLLQKNVLQILKGNHIVPIKPCQSPRKNITTSKPTKLKMHELKPNSTCVVCLQNSEAIVMIKVSIWSYIFDPISLCFKLMLNFNLSLHKYASHVHSIPNYINLIHIFVVMATMWTCRNMQMVRKTTFFCVQLVIKKLEVQKSHQYIASLRFCTLNP